MAEITGNHCVIYPARDFKAVFYNFELYPHQAAGELKTAVYFLDIKGFPVTFAVPKTRVKNAYNSTASTKRKRNYQGQE